MTTLPASLSEHQITTRKTPIYYLIQCSCGWHFETSRKQNAWARAAKIRAAISRHTLASGAAQ